MSWDGRTVLVTGGEGFIGSHLVERLVAEGATTRALVLYNSFGSWGLLDDSPVKSEVDVTLGDIRDRDSVERAVAGADVVFHLAALIAIPYSYSAPASYVETNVTGTLNVLSAARDAGAARVVHTSTSEVYGTALHVPIPESHPLQGQSPYSASKIGADKIAEAFHLSYGVPVSTLRPFNTYGPRQSARAVIPTIVTQALARERIELGSLTPTRDFTYVGDMVDAFLATAETDAAVGETINAGSSREISVGELAELIRSLVGSDAPVVSTDARERPPGSEVQRLCADSSKAQALLGWSPKTPLREGLAETIRWIEDHLDRYRVESYVI